MLTATKIFEFSAGHKLPNYDGKCSTLHGHNYKLEVEVSEIPCYQSKATKYPCMVCDFHNLGDTIKDAIVDRLDHQCINDLGVTEEEKWNKMIKYPTAESMVEWIVSSLKFYFRSNLIRVRLWETSTCYIEWRKGNE